MLCVWTASWQVNVYQQDELETSQSGDSGQRCHFLCRAKKAREVRQAGDSAKRRKMTEELERREKAFASERNEEHAARARLKVCGHFLCKLRPRQPEDLHGVSDREHA